MAGPIRIAILANGRQAKAEMRGVASQAGIMGGALKRTAGLIGGVFAVTELARAGKAVLQVGGDYVSSLNKIKALTGSSQSVMDRAARQIEANAGAYAKMGQTTGDAASGVVELTKAGMSLSDSLKAIRSTMTLAKAGELSVADASTLVANTLNTFSLKAKDAGRIANGLANAANISSADVSDLAESFKYVSPIAAKAGVSLDQTSAILAELSNSGVKASQAGTGLRKFLLSLQAPTGAAKNVIETLGVQIYDTQGRMLPFSKVVGNLQGAMKGLSQQEQNTDLKAIFGLTGVTPAQIILKNGVKGLADYTKGVQRAGAAQRLANAASQGLKGQLDSLKASVISSAQAWYREYSPKISQGISDLIGWVDKNKASFIETGNSLKDTFLPPLKVLLSLAQAAAKFLGELPAPIKTIAVEAGIAALVLPRLTASVTGVTGAVTVNMARLAQWRAEMTYTATRSQALSGAMVRLGGITRQVAGIAGMVALTQSTQQADKGLKSIFLTAGGAAGAGFAVGGPVGAGIGFVAGETYGLIDALRNLPKPYQAAVTKTLDFKSALEQTSGKITDQIRQMILLGAQQAGVVSLATRMGISQRDVIGAVQGNVGATKRLSAAYRQNFDLLDGHEQAVFNHWITTNTRGLATQRAEVRQNINDLKTWKQILHGLPKKLQTDIKQLGADASIRQIRQLAHEYHMSPKKLLTRIELAGINVTGKSLKQLRADLKNTGNTKPGNQWLRFFLGDVNKGKTTARRGGHDLSELLVGPLHKAKPNLSPFKSFFASDISGLKRSASSGGRGIGSNLSSGVVSGIAVHAADAASAALVGNAIAAARRAADAHSPSRKMRQLGNDYGDGLVLGMRERERQVRDAGERLAGLGLAGTTDRHARAVGAVQSRGATHTERIVETLPRGRVSAHIEGFGDVAMRFVDDRVSAGMSADRRFQGARPPRG